MLKTRSLLYAICSVSLVLLPGCGRRHEQDKIGIVVSVLPQSQFAERIGGNRVRVTVMVPPGANPHTYEPTPGQLVEVSRAKMYAKVGSDIEFELAWLDKIISANERMLVVDCSEGIDPAGTDSPGNREAGGRHNRHEAQDPHIWVSPRNAMIMVGNICKGLVSIDPRNRDYYESNMDTYINILAELDVTIEKAFSGKTDRKFIVYHPSWGYLAMHYGLEQLPVEEEGKTPTLRRIRLLIEQARRHNINTVFANPQFSTGGAEVVANEIGGDVVLIDPLEKNYVNNIKEVVEALAESMK